MTGYNHKYSEIVSFEDLRIEKERLILKSRLAEAKINLDVLHIRKAFSVSNLFLSFAKEYIFPRVSDFLGDLTKKVEKEVKED